ncbi:PE family protein [Mycobacterium sp. HUMS_1102779]|uniref:PE family protein n=1 Tax=Mycobacterium sp. HUMS_1102779 TaxID=3383487 RepID=UPI00389A86F3
MSFVTTQPEALSAAASTLQHLGTSMAAENAAAAAPTTGLVPAAADEVSVLQATQFAAYGNLYQAVSAQAAAIHQMLVNTLGSSAGSYGTTEAANHAATASSALSGLAGAAPTSAPAAPSLSSLLSTLSGSNLVSTSAGSALGTPINWTQTVGAAASDFFTLAAGAFWPGASEFKASEIPDYIAAGLMGSVSPAGSGGSVLAGLGQASSLGGMSVPPSWAAAAAPAVSPAPAALVGEGWAAPAPHAGSVTALPAGVPSMANAGRGGLGLGAPRYGAKPTVMPKPTVV